MKKKSNYEILGHTADIRMKVFGASPEELFRNALLGMNHILRADSCNSAVSSYPIEKKIKISSADRTALLVDFLSEVLSLSHENKSLFCDVTFLSMTGRELEAGIKGNKTDGFDRDIKAVTYHEAEIINVSGNGFETMIVFDI